MKPPFPAPVTEWHNDTYDAINPKRPELSQAGKTVVITGASQGIGREIVDAFAQAGATNIHILGRSEHGLTITKSMTEAAHPGVAIVIHVADLVDSHALEDAAKKIGPWDVIVANAGYISEPATIESSDAEEWWKNFEINIKGSYFLSRAFLPYKKAGSSIVAHTSGFAILPPSLSVLSKSSAYTVSKMGATRFYEFLAVENPDLNVYIVQPGVIRTALYDKGDLQLDSTVDTIQLPAHFAVWLASPEAKSLSGSFLFANWDVEQLKTVVAPRVAQDPVFLRTSLGGFPFAA